MPGKWLTPDVEPGVSSPVTIDCPDSVEFRAILKGCLLLLADPKNFEEYGLLSPSDVARIFLDSIQGALDT